MTKASMHLMGALVVVVTVGAQEAKLPTFEVAAIREVPYSDEVRADILAGRRGSSMTVTESRVVISYLSLAEIVQRAFAVERYAMAGPAWLEELRFDIQATIPAGVSREHVPAMLQALLVQRFQMVTRRESREMPAFVLLVGGDGHRLRPAEPEAAPDSQGAAGQTVQDKEAPTGTAKPFSLSMKTESNGTMTFRLGPNDTIETIVPRMTMGELARNLTGILGRPVFDRTGLIDSYQFTLAVTMSDVLRLMPSVPQGGAMPGTGPASAASEPSGASSLVDSVEKLGLKLESRRMPVDVVVVESMSRTPTPN